MRNNSFYDPEDIEDVLKEIERSYAIRFEGGELSHIRTFGELSDHILTKLNKKDSSDCTTQQAFYKLREAILATTKQEKASVHPTTLLDSLFPKRNRRRQIADVENQLGFKINALLPSNFMVAILALMLLIAVVCLFFNWQIGIFFLCLSVSSSLIFPFLAIDFKAVTVGQLADRMALENYFYSRRNPETINRAEVISNIEKLFIDNLGVEPGPNGIERERIIIE